MFALCHLLVAISIHANYLLLIFIRSAAIVWLGIDGDSIHLVHSCCSGLAGRICTKHMYLAIVVLTKETS